MNRTNPKVRARWGGLQTKMILWFLVPTTIILSVVTVLAFNASRRGVEDLVFDRSRDRTRLLASQLATDLERYQQPLRTLAWEIAGSRTAQGAIPPTLNTEWPGGELGIFDAGILVLDPDRTIVAAVPTLSALVGETLSVNTAPPRDPGPQPGLQTPPALGLTNIHADLLESGEIIAMLYPLGNDGEEEDHGAVAGLFQIERQATRTSSFYRNIWELYIGRRVTTDASGGSQAAGQEAACLVDGNGRIIFHTDTFLIGEGASRYTSVQRAIRGEVGAMRTQPIWSPKGPEVVTGYSPVPFTSWALITEEPWSQVTRVSRPYTYGTLALLVLGTLIPMGIIALGARRITRPVERLTEAAKALAAGHFEQTIEVHTGDELETLAAQFNTMARELQASYAHLEQRVADRTRELATINAVAAVVSRSLELEEIMEAALRQTLEAMGLRAGAALRLEESTLTLMAHHGFSARFVDQVQELPLSASVASEAARARGPVVRPVTSYPPGTLKRALEEEGLIAVVCIPLIAKDTMLGVLNMALEEIRELTPEERSMLASIGRQTGLAVENARLYGEAEKAAAAAERNRLARDLHDAISQTLFTASLIAEVIPSLWERNPEEAKRQLKTLSRLTRGAQAEMRTLLMELRPTALTETELETLFGHLGRATAARADVEVDLDLEESPALPPDVKLALYRIAQEALNNIVKHARADCVTLRLHRNGESNAGVAIEVEDDGCGFDVSAVTGDHFGLKTMRERAEAIHAAIDVASRPGAGTIVSVRWEPDKNHETMGGDP